MLTSEEAGQLMAKLLSKGLLAVIPLVDGMSYLTKAQLEKDILSTIEEQKAIHSVSLARMLDMDVAVLRNIVAGSKKINKTVFLDRAAFISVGRLDEIFEELMARLQVDGIVRLSKYSVRYGLSQELLTAYVARRLAQEDRQTANEQRGTENEDRRPNDAESATTEAKKRGRGCVLNKERGVLTNESYMERCRHRIIGRFRALIEPAHVVDVLKELKIPMDLSLTLLSQQFGPSRPLSHFGSVNGRGDRAIYEPVLYTRKRTAAIVSAFSANHFVVFAPSSSSSSSSFSSSSSSSFSLSSSSDIAATPTWSATTYLRLLSDVDPQALALSTCIVGTAVQTEIEAAITDCIASNSIINLSHVAPTPCTHHDVRVLFDRALRSLAMHEHQEGTVEAEDDGDDDPRALPKQDVKDQVVLFSTHVVPTALLSQLVASFADKLERAFQHSVASTPERPEFRQQSIIHTGKNSMTRSTENVRSGGSRKTKLKTRDKRRLADSQSPVRSSSFDSDAMLLSGDEIRAHICSQLPDLDGSLVTQVFDHILPELNGLASTVISRLQQQLHECDVFGKRFETGYLSALLFWSQAKIFGDEDNVLADYHVKTNCTQVLRTIVEFQQAISLSSASSPLSSPSSTPRSSSSSSSPLLPADAQSSASPDSNPFAAVSSFPPTIRTFIGQLSNALQLLNPDQFFTLIQEKMPVEINLKRPSLDSYTERSLISQHIQTISEHLRTTDDGPRFLQLFLSFLLFTRCGILLHSPGRWMLKILQRLQPLVSQRAFENLNQMYQWCRLILTKTATPEVLAKVRSMIVELRVVARSNSSPEYGRALTEQQQDDGTGDTDDDISL